MYASVSQNGKRITVSDSVDGLPCDAEKVWQPKNDTVEGYSVKFSVLELMGYETCLNLSNYFYETEY